MVQQNEGQCALLRVRSGPLAGQSYTLDRANIVIGREKGCNIRPDQYQEVSRRHARIVWDQGFCVEDLGSRNRTTVEGAPIVGRRRLQDGDVITLGDFSVQFLLPPGGVLAAPARESTNDKASHTATAGGKIPVTAIAGAVIGIVALGIFGSLNGPSLRSANAASPSKPGAAAPRPDHQATTPAPGGEETPPGRNKGEDDKPTGPQAVSETELKGAALEQVKDATVLIAAKNPDRDEYSQGSGFCALGPNVVVTNAHVVLTDDAQPRIALLVLVLHSGQKGQKAARGQVIAVDTENDLALVKIIGENDLQPLPLGDPTALKETEVCFACGFPGVKAISSRPPEVSVQRVSVEALRKDDSGALSRIQLGGTVTHGNSGGPVVDHEGRVVGVVREAARTPEGVQHDPQQAAGISYAIPVTRLSVMLDQAKAKAEHGTDAAGPDSKSEP
jgi:S1-C subfamily serine protease